MVVKDLSVIDKMKKGQGEALGKDAERFGSWLEINYMADVAGNAETQKDQILAAYHKTWDRIYETNENAGDQGFNGILECRSSEVDSFRGVFGLFFIGVFLGILVPDGNRTDHVLQTDHRRL